MVSRKGVVYRVGEDIEAVVKEKDQKQYDERKDAKLDGSADLLRHEHGHGMIGPVDIRSCVSSLTNLEGWEAGRLTFLCLLIVRGHGTITVTYTFTTEHPARCIHWIPRSIPNSSKERLREGEDRPWHEGLNVGYDQVDRFFQTSRVEYRTRVG